MSASNRKRTLLCASAAKPDFAALLQAIFWIIFKARRKVHWLINIRLFQVDNRYQHDHFSKFKSFFPTMHVNSKYLKMTRCSRLDSRDSTEVVYSRQGGSEQQPSGWLALPVLVRCRSKVWNIPSSFFLLQKIQAKRTRKSQEKEDSRVRLDVRGPSSSNRPFMIFHIHNHKMLYFSMDPSKTCIFTHYLHDQYFECEPSTSCTIE